MPRRPLSLRSLAMAVIIALTYGSGVLGHPVRTPAGSLVGTGESGNIDLVGVVTIGDVADVVVNAERTHAFAVTTGGASCSTDAGTWIIDITTAQAPEAVDFVPLPKGSRPSGSIQVVDITTPSFSGEILVIPLERCAVNGVGGISLVDVRNPPHPKKLVEGASDFKKTAHDTVAAFAWNEGTRAFVAVADAEVVGGIDIYDITVPKQPALIVRWDLTSLHSAVAEPGPFLLTEFGLENVAVKVNAGHRVMLLSYLDGGFILLNIDDVTTPILIADTDYGAADPELLERTGARVVPEGNAHQAAFTADNQYIIGIDQDFAPFGGPSSEFDGWGYVHLYRNGSGKLPQVDSYAIEEAFHQAFAVGFGDLSAHEVATHPTDPRFAYIAYRAGGLRSLEIQCSTPLSCELVEIGKYLDASGNDFSGIEAFVRPRDGATIVLASDVDSGVWIFQATLP